jgi:hypothetical protein
VFQTIQQQFLVEVTSITDDRARHRVASLEELNDLLDHWVREVYHQRAHSETGQSLQARYQAASGCLAGCRAAGRGVFLERGPAGPQGRLRLKELITRIPGTFTYRLTGDGIRFAAFSTLTDRQLLRPLMAADQLPASPELRGALRVLT